MDLLESIICTSCIELTNKKIDEFYINWKVIYQSKVSTRLNKRFRENVAVLDG